MITGASTEERRERSEWMNKKASKEIRMPLVVTLTLLFMMGLWAVDTSASAISGGRLTGIFGEMNPFFIYHLGFILAVCSFAAVAFLAVRAGDVK